MFSAEASLTYKDRRRRERHAQIESAKAAAVAAAVLDLSLTNAGAVKSMMLPLSRTPTCFLISDVSWMLAFLWLMRLTQTMVTAGAVPRRPIALSKQARRLQEQKDFLIELVRIGA